MKKLNDEQQRLNNLVGPVNREQLFAQLQAQTRRHFLRSFGAGVGTMFLGTLQLRRSSAHHKPGNSIPTEPHGSISPAIPKLL